jgi:hypothetical protein
MKTTQVRTLDAGRRVQGFLDANAATIATAMSASLRAKFDAAVTQLDQLRLDQETSKAAAAGETVNQAALRSDLFQQLVDRIGEVAKLNLKSSTDFPALVVTAAAEKRTEFVTKVNSQADAAAKYEQLFIDHGLPADFLAQIKAGVAQVMASAANREAQQTKQSAATGGLITADKAVRSLIKVVSGALAKVVKGNSTLSAGWVAAKRIRQVPVTPLPTGGTVITPTTPTTPTASSSTAATPPQQTTAPAPVPPAAA